MADVTELRCWPSCVDALDWSQDNIIALASDERVELLFPNTVSYERDNDVPQWQHVPLQVPWFSNDELPVKDPAPLSNYSVGEEISPSVPTAISWSPPGLAKHRRCALAVLTSNLVLSVWSAEGKLHEESSWSRRLLINHALTDYFVQTGTTQTSRITSSVVEQLRLRTRIRSFTWAPALPSIANTLGTQASYGRQYLAIANDDNHLIFLYVESPTSTLGSSQDWKATVLTHMIFEPKEESTFTDPLFFDDLMKQQRFISHVAWGPWVLRGDSYQSVIVYATNEGVRGRMVTCTNNHFKLGAEVIYPEIDPQHIGPISCCPKLDSNGQAIVALFTNSGLVYLTISANDASVKDKVTHDLDGRWDQISGAVWDYENNTTPRLHFSSLLSTVQSPTAVLEKSARGLTSAKAPNWKERIENSMVLFSVKNDLKGYSKTKVWGLTDSPLGDFIATCNSLHPSDSIEYGPPADRRGTVALSTLRQYSKIRQQFPHRNTTAEGVLFTLKKLVENTVEDADQMPAFAKEIVDKMLFVYKPMLSEDNIFTTELDNLEELVARLKTHVIFAEDTLRDRYSILVSHACNDTTSNELAKTLISYRLATVLQKLPSELSQTEFSKEILLHHRQLVALIDSLFNSDADSETMEGQEPEQSVPLVDGNAMDTDEAPSGNKPRPHGAIIATDQCDFCSAHIPFTDLSTATCANGHEFPRTPFLSEEFLRVQEVGTEADAEAKVTLASVLFQTCDIKWIESDDRGLQSRDFKLHQPQHMTSTCTKDTRNIMSSKSTKQLRILITGLTVDSEIPPYFRELFGTPDEIQAAIDADEDRIRDAGYDVTSFQVDDADPAAGLQWIEDKLRSEHFDGIMIGSGLRLIPEQTALFEDAVDVCRRVKPDAVLMCNSGPGTNLDTLHRNLGKF
ncbi:hypothetical protein OPT61_g996 [Boeremia exigua]|uniref:Uncharacterized protein n=1 Tax=Boeremia exigua TaxID=749465 RepID=A0ACC2IRR7_9PLEO|nr:hypothetical protein OPT61_g996 [Boeremia exigua]